MLVVSSDLSESVNLANCATGSRGGRASPTRGLRGDRGGRRAASSTLALDRSFDNESRIFGEAGIESSVISSSELGGIPESPAAPIVRPFETRKQERERLEREEILRGHAQTPVTRRASMQDPAAATETLFQRMHRASDQALEGVAKSIWLLRW